jgi:iron complex transport system substrate-binding protein
LGRIWTALTPIALTACTQAPPPPASRAHPTIVSLNPCSDEVLAAITAPGQLLAISHYSHDPASSSMGVDKARAFRSVSGSAEEVLALHPDVVVTGSFLPPTTRAALERGGVRVESIGIATSIADSKLQVTKLAGIAGNENGGILLNARIDAALARAAAPRKARKITAVLWQSGGIVPGQGTLIADIMERTGFASYSAMKGMGQADVLPLEEMLADPPQVILSAGNPLANEDRLLRHRALDALTDTRRVRFDPSLVWCGGPTIIRAAQRLAQVRGS